MDLSRQIERLNELEQQLNKKIQFYDDAVFFNGQNTPPLWWTQSIPLSISKNRKKIINLQKEHNRFLQKRLDFLKNKSRFIEFEEKSQEKKFAAKVKPQKEYVTLLGQERIILEELEGVKDSSHLALTNQDLVDEDKLNSQNIVEKENYAKIDIENVRKVTNKTFQAKDTYNFKVDYFTSDIPKIKFDKGYFAIRQNSVTVFYCDSKKEDYFFAQPLEEIIKELKESFTKIDIPEANCVDVTYIDVRTCDKKYLLNLIEQNKRNKEVSQLQSNKINKYNDVENQLLSASKIALNCILASIVDGNTIYVFENVENVLNNEDLSHLVSCLSMNKNNTIVLFTSEPVIAKSILGARVYIISSKEFSSRD